MKGFSKILKWNMIILFSYTILVRLVVGKSDHSEGALGILIVLMFIVGLHVLTDLIISITYFSSGQKELGKSYLLATFLVLVIGFSSCWGAASI